MDERDIVVLGGAISKFTSARADGTIRDWVVEAVIDALADAAVDIRDIEHGTDIS